MAMLGPLAFLRPPSAAQDPSSPGANPTPRVALVQSAGPPGGLVAVPIQFTGSEASPIGALTLTLRFSTTALTFSKAEIGGVAASVDAAAAAVVQQRGAETSLEVTIRTPEQAGARAALPDGPIAQLMFTVGKDQKPETVVPMKLEAVGHGLKVEGDAVKVFARDGEIIVGNPPVISCFFYMH